MQVALKAKADEVSEMQLRVSVAEKKLENTDKDEKEKITKLEQQLLLAEEQKMSTEREYERMMDRMHKDIEGLEAEIKELKEAKETMTVPGRKSEALLKSPGAYFLSTRDKPCLVI